MLESIGLVHRDYNPTIPPQVSYELSDRGKELSRPLYHLYDLAIHWYGDDREIQPSAPTAADS